MIISVVGDRRLLRYYRGKQGNVEEAVKMIKYHLNWRKQKKLLNKESKKFVINFHI